MKSKKEIPMSHVRKTWTISPRTRIHSSEKGKKGYNRAAFKKADKNQE